jgi:hypothetical protein
MQQLVRRFRRRESLLSERLSHFIDPVNYLRGFGDFVLERRFNSPAHHQQVIFHVKPLASRYLSPSHELLTTATSLQRPSLACSSFTRSLKGSLEARLVPRQTMIRYGQLCLKHGLNLDADAKLLLRTPASPLALASINVKQHLLLRLARRTGWVEVGFRQMTLWEWREDSRLQVLNRDPSALKLLEFNGCGLDDTDLDLLAGQLELALLKAPPPAEGAINGLQLLVDELDSSRSKELLSQATLWYEALTAGLLQPYLHRRLVALYAVSLHGLNHFACPLRLDGRQIQLLLKML